MIKYNIEVNYEKMVRNKFYADIAIHRKKEQHNTRKESDSVKPIRKDNVCSSLYGSNDDANKWIHRKPYNM